MAAIADIGVLAVLDDLPEPVFLKHADEDGAAFTDVDRRTIANLSIPRNVQDLAHVLWRDPHMVNRDPSAVHEHLLGLEERGLVTNLGTHSKMGKLAHLVERHPTAWTMPDEKAAIFARRLASPYHEWRVQGDVWMLTYQGLETIQAAPVNAPGPLTPSQLEAIIAMEYGRILPDHKPGMSVAPFLLVSEYQAWLEAVLAECSRCWSSLPEIPSHQRLLPVGGGASGWSDAYEVSILDQENQKTAIGAVVDPWFMALATVAITDADTGSTTTAPTYTGYARKSVAGTDMAAATSGAGSAANTSAITFAACTAGTSAVIAFANTSATTAGTLRKWGDCASTTISTTQTPAQFAIGAYVTTAA